MNFLGVDIGGSTRNGFAVVTDTDKLLYSGNIPFDRKGTKFEHRKKIVSEIQRIVSEYNIQAIGIERVKMHRGSNLSKLSGITSLMKITTSILDNFSDICEIKEFETVSWKSEVLGNRSATKEDAVNFVKYVYRKEVPHDEADAICEAIFLSRNYNREDTKMKDITFT